MNLLGSAPDWLAILFLLLLLVAALEDVWRLEIDDWLSAGIAIAAFLGVAIDGSLDGIWQNLLLFSCVLGLGTLLFVRGWMGGADVKLLAASSLWFDLDSGWKMLVAVAIAGGLVTLLIMLLRLLPWPESVRRRLAIFRKDEAIAYGVAITAGVTCAAMAVR